MNAVATLRRREAERRTNLVLAVALLGLAAVSFALSRPVFEWILAPRALEVGLEVATAQMVAVAVAVVCGALCVVCVGVLIRDARSLDLCTTPSTCWERRSAGTSRCRPHRRRGRLSRQRLPPNQ